VPRSRYLCRWTAFAAQGAAKTTGAEDLPVSSCRKWQPSSSGDSLARAIEATMNNIEWMKIEADFRFWSFHEYYNRIFKSQVDPEQRFLQALLASLEPIRDREAVITWHRYHKRSRRGERVGRGGTVTKRDMEQIASDSRKRSSNAQRQKVHLR
jgi:hypothetical protein